MIFHADAIGLNFNNEAFILTPDLISNLIAMQKNNGR
jgi:hypothetical protein